MYMRILFELKLLILSLLLTYVTANSQTEQASPLESEGPMKQKEIGLVVGLGQNILNGTAYPECENCKYFNSGTKLGYTVGLAYIHDINRYWQWGSQITFNTMGFSSTFRLKKTVNFISVDNPLDTFPTDVPFRYTGEFDFSYLTLAPFIQWEPVKWFFVRLGADVSTIISSHVKNTEEITQTMLILPTGDTAIAGFPSGDPKSNLLLSSRTIEDGEFGKIPANKLNTFQFGITPTIGFNFEIANYTYLSPIFQFTYPLTTVSDYKEGFKIMKWRLLLELKMALQVRD